MSLDELVPDEQAEQLTEIPEDTTIQTLIDIYGEEAVRRGISYMASLREADEEFRKSTSKDHNYAQKMSEALTSEDVDVEDEMVSEANSSWEESMEGDGLGLDG